MFPSIRYVKEIGTTVDNVPYRFFTILMYKEIVTTNILIEHTLLDNLFKCANYCTAGFQEQYFQS